MHWDQTELWRYKTISTRTLAERIYWFKPSSVHILQFQFSTNFIGYLDRGMAYGAILNMDKFTSHRLELGRLMLEVLLTPIAYLSRLLAPSRLRFRLALVC